MTLFQDEKWVENERQIWVINGFPRSGKDTFCRQFIQWWIANARLKNGELLYSNTVSSIDPVFELLAQAGIPMNRNALTDKERCLLSEVGASLEKYADFRTQRTLDMCYTLFDKSATIPDPRQGRLIFVHMREPDLIEKFKALVSTEFRTAERIFDINTTIKTLLVRRPDENKFVQNESDQNVLNYDYDVTILNSGSMQDLVDFVPKFANDVLNGVLKSEYSTTA